MKKILNVCKNILSTRLGFILTLLFFYWLKTIWAYTTDFALGWENPYQIILSLINPIPLGLLLIGLALYVKKTKPFYITAWIIYTLVNVILIANAVYYREFSDFITVSAALASSKTSAGLGDSALNLLRVTDIFFIIDYILLGTLFATKKIKHDSRPFSKRASFATTALSALLFSVNLFLAEIDRPELLSRGFSNVYVVRALGLPNFSLYSANQTYQAQKERNNATASELTEAKKYVKEHYAKPNDKYYGIAKGRNVIMIHLESFQQFLIDYKLNVNGTEHEVTPFINSLYHSNSTISFSNFFHQVKAGKTSDAETLMENSLFGLNSGSFMVNYGGDNTQFAAPNILAQNGGYTSAVFHGNVGTFWNRNNAYKQWGYNYFFDSSYLSKLTKTNSFQYGLNDKFVIMYSGNIGLYYDLENLIKVVERFKPGTKTADGREVAFAFVGAGSVLDKLVLYVRGHHMDNVTFIPYQDKADLIYSLNAGDVHWCVNAKGIKGVSCPSKAYGIMAASKPILGVLESGSEVCCLIEDTHGGLCCEPGEYDKVEENISWFIKNAENSELKAMGARGRENLEKNLTKNVSVRKYAEEILKL